MTFSNETRKLALISSNGYCQCSKECTARVTEFHHKCPNTKLNKKLYPIFLQSIFNCCPINHDCHMTKPLPNITNQEADTMEQFLRNLIKTNQRKES